MNEPTVEIERERGVAVVVIGGEHDMASAPRVREAMAEAARSGSAVVVELTPTQFMDSSILGVLLGALHRAKDGGTGFTFALSQEGGSVVHRLFEVTGLFALFPVYPSRSEAVTAAAGGINDPAIARG